jgi:hypothetical protein
MQTRRLTYKASGFPAVRAQQNAVVLACFVQVVDPQLRPVEQHLDLTQGSRVDLLVDLVCEEHSLTWIFCSDESDTPQ